MDLPLTERGSQVDQVVQKLVVQEVIKAPVLRLIRHLGCEGYEGRLATGVKGETPCPPDPCTHVKQLLGIEK